MPKRYYNFEMECGYCERQTWFEEDLDQVPERNDEIIAFCTSCQMGVRFFGSNAE